MTDQSKVVTLVSRLWYRVSTQYEEGDHSACSIRSVDMTGFIT